MFGVLTQDEIMPKRSTEFQDIVAIIHRVIGAEECVTIEESAMLIDCETQTEREVDIVIRQKMTGYEVIVSIEVNERSRPVDQQYVEQIIRKHEKLPTNRLVIVSKNGFTSSARIKAKFNNVIMPEYSEFQGTSFLPKRDDILEFSLGLTFPEGRILFDNEEIDIAKYKVPIRCDGIETEALDLASDFHSKIFDRRSIDEEIIPLGVSSKVRLDIDAAKVGMEVKYKGKWVKPQGAVVVEVDIRKIRVPIISKVGNYDSHQFDIIVSEDTNDEQGRLFGCLPAKGRDGFLKFRNMEMRLPWETVRMEQGEHEIISDAP